MPFSQHWSHTNVTHYTVVLVMISLSLVLTIKGDVPRIPVTFAHPSTPSASDWQVDGYDKQQSYVNTSEHTLGADTALRLRQIGKNDFKSVAYASATSPITLEGVVYIANETMLYRYTSRLQPVDTFQITLEYIHPYFSIIQLAAIDDIIYLSTNVGEIVAFNIQQKKQIWNLDLWKENEARPTHILLANDTLYAVLANTVYAIDKVSGTIKWQYQNPKTKGHIQSIAAAKDYIFIQTWDPPSPPTWGYTAWVYSLSLVETKPRVVHVGWEKTIQSSVLPLTIAGETLYLVETEPDKDLSVVDAINLNTGKDQRMREVNFRIYSIAVAGDIVYALSQSIGREDIHAQEEKILARIPARLYAIESLLQGDTKVKEIGQLESIAVYDCHLVVANGVAYIELENAGNYVVAVNLATGTQLWSSYMHKLCDDHTQKVISFIVANGKLYILQQSLSGYNFAAYSTM